MITVDERAPCVRENPERFFPGRGASLRTIEETRALCDSCPFLEKCRKWAIAHEKRGIWGGMTEYQRRLERRRQGISLDSPRWSDTVSAARSEGERTTCWECGESIGVTSLRRHEETFH